MPTFIKTGYWDKLSRAPKEYLNLDLLISTALPSQAGNGGKFLSTNGSTLSWENVPLTNYIPYNGATQAVNLGSFDLTVNGLTVGRGLGGYVNNTVVGSQAGAAFTTAQTNVAIGEQALKVHSTGNGNTAVGRYAMLSDVDGTANTALGASALVFLATGVNTGNTAIGVNGLGRLTSGSYNTWLGYTSSPGGILTSGSFNTIIGAQINVGVASLSNNIILADGQGNIRIRAFNTGNVSINSNTDIASAQLQVESTAKGFLPPRMTTAQKNAIVSPAAGLVVYDLTTNKLCCFNGTIWNDLF